MLPSETEILHDVTSSSSLQKLQPKDTSICLYIRQYNDEGQLEQDEVILTSKETLSYLDRTTHKTKEKTAIQSTKLTTSSQKKDPADWGGG